MRIFLFFSILVLITTPCSGEIFSWTDGDGIKHFSNIKPPPLAATQKILEKKSTESTKPLGSKTSTKSKYSGGNTDTHNTGSQLFQVIKVYDGDSMKVKGSNLTFMVRLAGIDAPETGYKKLPGQPFSQESKKMLQNLVSGKMITVKSYGTGFYNRQLAEVFADGINVNLAMLKAGMAERYRGEPVKGLDFEQYKNAEASAKRTYRGIWNLGGSYQSPKSWRKSHPRK